MLLLLAAIGGPEHPLFQKGYVPPVEVDIVQPLFKQPLVDNRDGFFDAAQPVSFWWEFAKFQVLILPFAVDGGSDA